MTSAAAMQKVPSRITPTYLRQAESCSYALLLRRSGFTATEPTSDGWVEGSVVHDVLETAYGEMVRQGHVGPAGVPAYTGRLAQWAFEAAGRHGLDDGRVPEVVEQCVDALMVDMAFDHREVLSIEDWLAGPLPGGMMLSAKVDQARRMQGDGVLLIDYKAKQRPDDPRLDQDVQAIAMLIVAAATWSWARKFEFRHVYTAGRNHARLQMTRTEIGWRARLVDKEWSERVERQRNGPWTARPGARCDWCEMRGRCAPAGGTPELGQPAPSFVERD